MSVYRQQTTTINDIDCLEDCLKEIRSRDGKVFHPERHEQKVNLEGYSGDKREQQAEIVLKRAEVGAAANDIGFERGEDGNFVAHISAYDSSYYNKNWLSELSVKYTEKKAMKIARQKGWPHLQTYQKNGKTVLKFAVNS